MFATNFAGTGMGGGGNAEHTHSVRTEFVNDADGDLNMKNHKITNLKDPTDENDSANKKYIDTTKHNLSSNLVLNSNQLWLGNDNTTRIQALQADDFNGAVIVAPTGLLVSTGSTSIFSASPTSISANNKRITSVKDPETDTDAVNKKYVDGKSSASPVNITTTFRGSNSKQTLTFSGNPNWKMVVISVFLYDGNVSQTIPRNAIDKIFTFNRKGDGVPGTTSYKYNYYALFALRSATDTSIEFSFYKVGFIEDGTIVLSERLNNASYAIQQMIFI